MTYLYWTLVIFGTICVIYGLLMLWTWLTGPTDADRTRWANWNGE
jgi:TRAP-type C4-dicarboxylate transport system permease small subunit